MTDDRAALPADWAQVLDRMDQSLEQSLAQVVEPPEPEAAPLSWQPLAEEIGHCLRRRLEQLDARTAQTRQAADQLEALLAFEADALTAWTTTAEQVRQRLAQAAARAVS